jgi:hypothetical protein
MKTYVFSVEIPYWRISIKKVQLFSKRVHSLVCDGNKKVVRLKFLFKEVKFRC